MLSNIFFLLKGIIHQLHITYNTLFANIALHHMAFLKAQTLGFVILSKIRMSAPTSESVRCFGQLVTMDSIKIYVSFFIHLEMTDTFTLKKYF